MAITANQLSSVSSTLLPPTITDPIFKKASETSAVMQLARKVPLSVNAATAIPITMDIPTADWVSEGGTKTTGNAGIGVKIMTGKKVALLVPVSQELAMTNPAGLYSLLESDLPTSLGRAFDYAAIHGLSLKTGSAGPFADYLANTPNSQVIGSTAASSGGVYADLVKGIQQVVNAPTPGYDFNGFAADPRLRPELMLSVDGNGRPLTVDNAYGNVVGQGSPLQSLIGFPAAYNPGVSGKYYRQGDAVQVVTINGTPTGGTFTVSVAGQTTAGVAYNASAATLATAMNAVLPAGVTVAGSGSAGGPYTLTFSGGAAQITGVNQKSLTGGTAAASLATIAQSPVLDSGLRAIGGDWSQCAWGQGMDISIKVSTEASYTDGTTVHSAFQENLVLLLVEAYYGFVVNDLNAFVAYTHATGS